MLLSLGILILAGLMFSQLFIALKIPPLVGIIIGGILSGPYVLNLLSEDFIELTKDLRSFALIVILLRAGFQIHVNEIKALKFDILKLSSLGCILEGFALSFFAMYFLPFSFYTAALLGFIIAAVSPAVIVPLMLDLKKRTALEFN